ncbi:hypothetical protein [Flammeovirga kamogawensis]|uniref:DUF4382 domain-containing protein n=1 Tax=Flammeovirga kamogawensis TaxID=373891 RepID=A0ABX8GVJ4_9BACT|nr:hypothetical protein [Flammeovirga kamogawensis]MBB6461048.1 hypothetical protein [Flammeovirga kamogawensis]QWG07618.1 hypothetical protein KM029_01370 [Flammeovirga kamogawensis]TRX69429.1 hypothetical protein EO216_15310 [Flammeovirga kamogawensis]
MRYLSYSLLFFILFLCSCGFDASSFENIGIKPLESKFFAIPLLNGEITLNSLLSETDRAHVNTSETPWVLEYSTWTTEEEKEALPAIITGDQVLAEDNFILHTEILLPGAFVSGVIFPKEITFPVTLSNLYFDIQNLTIKDGFFITNIKNPNSTESSLIIELIHYSSTDTILIASTNNTIAANSNLDIQLNLDNKSLTLKDGYIYGLRLKNLINNQEVDFSVGSGVKSEIKVNSISNITFTPFFDFEIPIEVPLQITTLTLFDSTLDEGQVTLADLRLSMVAYNTFGLDIYTSNIEVYAQSSIDNEIIPLTLSKNQIHYPITLGEEAIDTLDIGQAINTLKKKPNAVAITGQVDIKMFKGQSYFIDETSYLKHNLFLGIPFEVGLKDVTFSTNLLIEDGFDQSVNFLDSAYLSIEFENHFPMDGTLEIYTLNSEDDISPYLIDLNSSPNVNSIKFMEAAKLNSDGTINETSFRKFEIRITGEDATNILKSKILNVRGIFDTPNGDIVPFYPTGKLLIKAGLAASVTIDPNEF